MFDTQRMSEEARVPSDERNLATLKDMWAEGASASEIARALGQGVSRMAVIGKVHRQAPGRDNSIRARTISGGIGKRGDAGNRGQAKPANILHLKAGRLAGNAKGLAFKLAQARKDGLGLAEGMEAVLGKALAVPDGRRMRVGAWAPLPGTAPVSLVDLGSGKCHWPVSEDRPHLFCGASATGSYCAHHQAMSKGIGTISERAAHKVRETA